MNTIYKITNLLNNKVYIGITSQEPHSRFKQHCSKAQPKYQSRSAINHAILKYGKDNFKFEIVFQSEDYEESVLAEPKFIIENNSLTESQGGWGYNIDRGGNAHKRSPETIAKHKAKVIGVKKTDEHRQNLSNALSGENNPNFGKYGKDNPCYGQKRPYAGKKISETRKLKDNLRESGVLPPLIRPTGYKFSEDAKQTLKDSHKPKYLNVKIKDPSGIIHELNSKSDQREFMRINNLNNFMHLTTSGKRSIVKGFSLVSFELNPDYNGAS